MGRRRITLRLYPKAEALAALDSVRRRHCDLYNAALQERRDAWRLQRVSIGYKQQCRSLTQIRAEMPEHRELIQRGQNLTLKRLDLAFAAFFRRVKEFKKNKKLWAAKAKKEGKPLKPGYPRFKSSRRFGGWSLAADEGYRYKPKVTASGRWFNGTLHLSRIGAIPCRGKSRNVAGRILQVDLLWRQGRWYASLAIECQPQRERGNQFVGLDWGVTDYATLAYADGTYATLANDRLFKAQQEKTAERQRRASKRLRGRRSRRADAQRLAIGRALAKLANQRKDRSHKASAKLVASCRLIATEKLQIANMTRSAKGTEEDPGKNVAQKAGLNREILDTAPGLLIQQIRYKAAEAGCELVEVNTRRVKPSQTCPQCDVQVKKRLDERQHRCGCGFEATRDQAAALVMLKRALEDYGRKPTGGGAPENAIQNGAAVWVA